MKSILSSALSGWVAKHIGLSATRRATLSWPALFIMQHGTISLGAAAYVASAAQTASVQRPFYPFFQIVPLVTPTAAHSHPDCRARGTPP